MNKKLFVIVMLFFTFVGCDGIEDSVVDPLDSDFSVTEVKAPSTLKYSDSNTKLTTSIVFTNTNSLLGVWVKVAALDGSYTITYRTDMVNVGGNEYAVSIDMNKEMPSLIYTIDYFFQTEIQEEKKIASHNFEYNNMQNNIAPVISDPLFYYENEDPMLRDTLENQKPFIFSIKVSDDNGLSDIDSVYTDFYSPNNPSAIRVLMYDDGAPNHGDNFAGDGIYSYKNVFVDAYGERKFEFLARDREGELSNLITHIVVVVK